MHGYPTSIVYYGYQMCKHYVSLIPDIYIMYRGYLYYYY